MPRPRYELHARRFAGSLAAPTVNEMVRVGAGSLAELDTVIKNYRDLGFTVWVFRADKQVSFGSDLTLVQEYRPTEIRAVKS